VGKLLFGSGFSWLATKDKRLVGRLVGMEATADRAKLVFGRELSQLTQAEKFFLTLTGKGRAISALGELTTEAALFMGVQAVEVAIGLSHDLNNWKEAFTIENFVENLKTILLLRLTNRAAAKVVGTVVEGVKEAARDLQCLGSKVQFLVP
jgi:hypothetical protein